jgi:hypothetical protein
MFMKISIYLQENRAYSLSGDLHLKRPDDIGRPPIPAERPREPPRRGGVLGCERPWVDLSVLKSTDTLGLIFRLQSHFKA